MRLYDTHCHFECADPLEIAATLARAKAAGVEKLMAVGGSDALNEAALVAMQVAAEGVDTPAVCVALGYDRDQVGLIKHRGTETQREERTMWGAVQRDDDSQSLCLCASVLKDGGPAAIGEIGLDYHYSPETREAQLKLFAAELEEARARNLPVVIHTREADDDTVALLREIPSRGIIHCYTGSPEFAKRYLDLGFYISISGIVTFHAADGVRTTALVVPDDRILIETDAPFLAPVPMRGNPNEPAFVKYTCEFLAKLRGTDPEAFAELTFANAERAVMV